MYICMGNGDAPIIYLIHIIDIISDLYIKYMDQRLDSLASNQNMHIYIWFSSKIRLF